ncbi:MAG: cytochrome c3 family protein [Candidatus Binatia bacterium]
MKTIRLHRFFECTLLVIVILYPLAGLSFDPAASTEFSIDQGSGYCLGCHDGTLASAVHHSHPVDVEYLLAQIKSNGKLKDLSQLDPVIFLKDDRVVCTSCHHPDSQLQAKLVITNDGSRLCISCHNL